MAEDERVGKEFGRYRVRRVLGRGGFGTVYLADDTNPHLPRRVALKVLNRELAADEGFRERFLRESIMAIELDHHPSIVPVYDAGEDEGTLYIAMRYIEGTDLASALVHRGPFPAEEAAAILSQVAGALDVANSAGLVHRDVKPGNVLLSHDMKRAYLADFGLTKRVSAESGLTRAGQFLGTFYYAAPEQIEGRPVDGRTDEYALGCVLYEMLTAKPPFSGDMNVIIAAHLTQPVPRPSEERADLSAAVDAVVARAMEKRPEHRFATCGELAAAAARALSREGDTALEATPVPLAPPPPQSTGPVSPPPPVSAPVSAPPYSTPPGVVTPPPGAPSPPPPSGPWGPSTPPPAPAPKRRSPVPFVIAGLVAAAVVVVLLVVFVFGGDDGGGGEFPNTDEEALLAQVPEPLRDTCVRGSGDPRVVEAEGDTANVRCTHPDDDRADAVFFTQFDDREAATRAFERAANDAGTEDSGDDCADTTGVEHAYITDENVEGRVLCFRDAGSSFLVWSSPEFRTVASATRDDRQDTNLFDFWAELLGVEPPEDGDGSVIVGQEEEELQSHIPGSFSGSCEALDPFPDLGELAALSCTPTDGADSVIYVQYDSAASMDDAYEFNLDDNGVTRDSGEGCDVGPPSENSYSQGEVTAGRALCVFDDDGSARLIWTHDELLIKADAVRFDGDYDALLAWWESDSGPNP